MRIEGEYLYPETAEEAITFLQCDYQRGGWINDDGSQAWMSERYLEVDCIPDEIRIHISVVREILKYRPEEPWCFVGPWGDDEEIRISNYHVFEWGPKTLGLHKRAIYLVNNAEQFRQLYDWLKEDR